MSRNILHPQNSQDSDAANGIEQKRAYFTLIQLMAIVLFLSGVRDNNAVSIGVGIALALAQEPQSTIKNFLSLIKEKTLPDNSKKAKDKDA